MPLNDFNFGRRHNLRINIARQGGQFQFFGLPSAMVHYTFKDQSDQMTRYKELNVAILLNVLDHFISKWYPTNLRRIEDESTNRRIYLRSGNAFICGAAIVAGFFLPWIEMSGPQILKTAGINPAMHGLTLPGLGEIKASGFDLARHKDTPAKTSVILLLCPVSGILLLIASFLGKKRWLIVLAAFIAGIGILSYPFYYIIRFLQMTTGLGLWLVIGAAFLSLVLLLSFLMASGSAKSESRSK